MEVWAALKHPNICELLGYSTKLGYYYPPLILKASSAHSDTTSCLRFLSSGVNTVIQSSIWTRQIYLFRAELDWWDEIYISISKLTPSQARDVCEGLQYLHRLKVIHGDLKPVRAISQSFPPSSTSHQKNVLVDKDGVAKLCDLGLVRLVDWEGSRGLTTTSPYTGTALYKAPELFISLVNRIPVATFEGDIYAIGCILLEVRMQVHKK
jgi:serine/threonine protein kinase